MLILYQGGIAAIRFFYWIASWFNPKAKAIRLGHKEQVDALRATFPLSSPATLVWVHCASLGEFEQGRPVMEALKTWKPAIKILLTFFSPSGYAVRKDYEFADYVFYLPWDTSKNAQWFAEVVRPSLVIFIKYEFWYHYSHELQKRKIPLISISAIFRPQQNFFKPYGSLFRTILKCFNHFFVQNQQSAGLLHSIGIDQVTIAGDTRFDRVNQIVRQSQEVPIVEQFKDGQKMMVIGSAWQEDMEVLVPFINENKSQLKFIVAPHELTENFLMEIERSLKGKSIRFSKAGVSTLKEFSVLIIDNIGMLSRMYRYGEFAFIGGAFRQGLHNILEAACYGIPIFFGNKAFQKYQEAVDLVQRGGAFDVENFAELKSKYELLIRDPQTFQHAVGVTQQYVQENIGATDKIMSYCKKLLT